MREGEPGTGKGRYRGQVTKGRDVKERLWRGDGRVTNQG